MKSAEVVAALGALAQESRLAVYHLLVRRGPDGYTPGELSAALEIPAPTLSFHLKELQRVGLVLVRREGRKLHYTADFARMRALVAYLSEKCCSLADEQCDADCKPVSAAKKRRVA
jgi:DNA-binding transcriptional ArsR family regulator